MREIIFIIAFLLPIFLTGQVQIHVEDFYCSNCQGNQIEDLHHFQNRIIDSTWVNDSFKIKIAVLANCATGSYYDAELISDTLILKYGIAPNYTGVFCDCPFEFQYLITNVPKKELQIKIFDNRREYLGKRIITRSAYKYLSEYYEIGLSKREYHILFTEKIEGEKKLFENITRVLTALVEYLEEGGCDEEIISKKISEYEKVLEEGGKYYGKSIDSFIKDVLGEEYVSTQEEELNNFLEWKRLEWKLLKEKLVFFDVKL